MTTNMFAPRIWGSDFSTPAARVVLDAGWQRSDILWEDLMVTGNVAWSDGDKALAAKCFRRAFWVTRLFFDRTDLRRATVLVNLGIVLKDRGHTAKASTMFRKALSHWDAYAGQAVAEMRIAPRARSSLFHLRMEARHRDTYHGNFRKRTNRIASEVRTAIRSYEMDHPQECRLYSRWIGEKPTVYDDTRKVFGACLLIAEAPHGSPKDHSLA